MKIVDVCAFYSPAGGGVRTYVDQKLAIGPKLGHEIVVIAPGDRDAVIERGPGARIVTIASPRFPLDRKYWYFDDEAVLHAALTREAPDFVEATSPWRSAGMVANWPGRAGRSLVMHADPLSAYAYRWFGSVFSRATIDRRFSMFWEHLRTISPAFGVTICANDDLRRRLAEGGVHNAETLPMGVDAGRFSPALRDAHLREDLLRECGLPADAALLVAVGRLSPEKRWPMVIDAVTAASAKAPIGLVIIGEGRDRRNVLKRLAGNPHIRLFGASPDRELIARILASADALIHGCEAETFCMVAAEARASGTPVIVPDRGGASDHARGGAGVTYRACDRASAAAAILEVLGNKRPVLTTPARTMDEHFSDLFGRYESLIAPRRHAA
jgi:alpha-1,6-mannosyltransferase